MTLTRVPITRRTELARGGPIRRTSAPVRDSKRVAKEPSKRPPAKRPAASGPAKSVLELIAARDKGRCVRCGAAASNTHHRKNRGMGGRRSADAVAEVNALGSLLSMCGSGTTGCHGDVTNGDTVQAAIDGYVVGTNTIIDPADVPVKAYDGWFLYDNQGGRSSCPPPALAD